MKENEAILGILCEIVHFFSARRQRAIGLSNGNSVLFVFRGFIPFSIHNLDRKILRRTVKTDVMGDSSIRGHFLSPRMVNNNNVKCQITITLIAFFVVCFSLIPSLFLSYDIMQFYYLIRIIMLSCCVLVFFLRKCKISATFIVQTGKMDFSISLFLNSFSQREIKIT